MNALIPFGKYRGQPVEVLQHDLPYVVDKLDSKSRWLHDLFGTMLHAAACKPQHNRQQDRFVFDEEFRRKVFYAFVLQNCSGAIHDLREAALSVSASIGDGCIDRRLSVGSAEPELSDCTDIAFRGSFRVIVRSSIQCEHFKLHQSDDEISLRYPYFYFWEFQGTLRIEVKPLLGEDYYDVLRKMKQNKRNCLFVDQFDAGISQDQLKLICRNDRIAVVFRHELEDLRPPSRQLFEFG